MATTPLPAFWTTTIAKALSGDQPCLLAAWWNGREHPKRPREDQASLTVWKTNHTAQLNEYVEKMRSAGWKCQVERFFKVTGQLAVISGKADIVGQQDGKRPVIVDIKSGQPRDSDVVQVIVEQVMIPLAWESPQLNFNGLVVYSDHTVDITMDEAEIVKPRIFAMLKKLAGPKPDPSPSFANCRFCDCGSDTCPDRIDAKEPAEAVSELF